jgi:hypothetical protein
VKVHVVCRVVRPSSSRLRSTGAEKCAGTTGASRKYRRA